MQNQTSTTAALAVAAHRTIRITVVHNPRLEDASALALIAGHLTPTPFGFEVAEGHYVTDDARVVDRMEDELIATVLDHLGTDEDESDWRFEYEATDDVAGAHLRVAVDGAELEPHALHGAKFEMFDLLVPDFETVKRQEAEQEARDGIDLTLDQIRAEQLETLTALDPSQTVHLVADGYGTEKRYRASVTVAYALSEIERTRLPLDSRDVLDNLSDLSAISNLSEAISRYQDTLLDGGTHAQAQLLALTGYADTGYDDDEGVLTVPVWF